MDLESTNPFDEILYGNLKDDFTDFVRHFPSPVIIQADGSKMLYGLTNRFCTNMPREIIRIVEIDVFQGTMSRINDFLDKAVSRNLCWWYGGALISLCTLGLSLCPSFALTNKTLCSLTALLENENATIYHKIGLNWRLHKGTPSNCKIRLQFALIIDFLPNRRM